MKRRSLLALVVLCCAFVLISTVSCSNELKETKPPKTETSTEKESAVGSISGKVIYSNLSDYNHGGVIVTLDQTDGLRTIAVSKSEASRRIANTARTIIANTVTESDGSYLFSNLEPGTYTIYATSTYSKERAVYTNVVVSNERTTVAETMKLTATGEISGRITTDGKTQGNAGYLVFLAGTSYMAMTDDYGNYVISDVPAERSYQVVVSKNEVIHNLSSNVMVTANRTTTMGIHDFSSLEFEEKLKGKQGEQGIQGENGLDGVSFKWLGAFDSADEIIDPKYLDAYFNKTDGCSYIWDGEEWTLLARSGKDGFIEVGEGIGEDSRNILAIGTLLSTEEITNQSVEITVNLTKSGLQKKGYVYSVQEPPFANADDVLNNSEFVSLQKDSDGKYKIMAEKNGYYTIAVKDNEDAVSYTQEQIINIDRIAPDKVSGLNARYDIDAAKLIVTWKNPSDSDFVYVDLSYTKRDKVQVENERIIDETYSIKNVRVDGSEYIFTLYSVDQAGNKSNAATISITPKGYSVGDVLLEDGTILPYGTNFTDAQKQRAIGVLYSIDEYGFPRGWLGIYNAGNSEIVWGYSDANLTGIECNPWPSNASTATFEGDTDGSDNWEYICENDSSAVAWGLYYAFEYVNEYASSYGLTGKYATGWYMPSIAELCYIYRNKDILNSVLGSLGGTKLAGKYWSSSQANNRTAWGMYFDSRGSLLNYTKNEIFGWASVCCIRKFR